MKKLLLFLFLASCYFNMEAQKNRIIKVPLNQEQWESGEQKLEFSSPDGVEVMKVLPSAEKVILKELEFSTGTIEFDIQPLNKGFVFMFFRYQDAKENEGFYFRTAREENPLAPDAIQYTPHIAGVNLWDMLPHYQSNALFKRDEWNQVKIEVSESQMRLYVNSDRRPTLEIPHLEGNVSKGKIAFEGELLLKNLHISTAEVQGLSHLPGPDPTDYDPRYIRSWMRSQPLITPENIDFSYDFMPTDTTQWENIEAERRGLVNLSREFELSESRRLVWLKVILKSEKLQTRKIDLGFSDELWAFLNNQLVHIDKNLYNQPMMKEPNGRISIENTSFDLPLQEGNNELLLGVANSFFGWGIIARLDKLDGIELFNDEAVYYFGRKEVTLAENIMESYAGKYLQPNGKEVLLAKENNTIKFSGDDLPTFVLYPEAERKFFAKEFNLQMELLEGESQNINRLRFYENGQQVLELEVEKQ
jgi:hypothetical protein